MAGFEIGGYVADFPIFVHLLNIRAHPENGALTFDGVWHADIGGHRCCLMFSDAFQADECFRAIKPPGDWGTYELDAADALNFLKWLPEKGMEHVSFDARVRAGDIESRTPISVADLITLLEKGNPPETR